MDSTQDISKTDQISFILRYAVVNYADCTFEIKESFLGAAVMSGNYSGVQKRISDIIPSASYVHCNAHNLNLVLCDLAKSSLKVS